MKRGLPKDGSSARDVRIRRAASASRGSSSSRSAPWWHQVLLCLLLLAPALLVKTGAGALPVAAYLSVAAGVLVLWTSYRLALRVAKPSAAFLATLTIWLASSAPVYLYVRPFAASAPVMPVFHWNMPRWFAVAFASEHGAFLWTPVLLLATLGLAVAIWRQPAFGAALLSVGALVFYLAAAIDEGADASSYGNAWLVMITPVFVCGLAALIDVLAGGRGRLAWLAISSMAVLFILWNLGLMLQWGTGMIPSKGLVDFRQVAMNQVTVVPHAAKDFVIRYINERNR